MNARHLACAMGITLSLGAACQRSQSGHAAAESSGQETTQGESSCAREPGEPPAVGEGASQTVQRPCASSRSVMGESGKRPDEL
jgi:hypothetical protein